MTTSPEWVAALARVRPASSLASVMDPVLWASTEAADAAPRDEGHVVFRVGVHVFAVPVSEVREVLRGVDVVPVPEAAHGPSRRPVVLVDVHGRTIPAVDLRTGPGRGDVLLPVWRRHLGLVVDRVEAVRRGGELAVEPAAAADALPAFALGLLRPAEGGGSVILVAMPDAATLHRAPTAAATA